MTAANKPLVSATETSAQLGTGGRVGQRLLERIGNTPLIRIERTAAEFPNATICAKAEWFNPGGSVKDRAAYSMIREGER
ncbi:MAG: pyridoxal-phosphate dependent enzyme, partial [Candidatus Acidiferrales bacterium]